MHGDISEYGIALSVSKSILRSNMSQVERRRVSTRLIGRQAEHSSLNTLPLDILLMDQLCSTIFPFLLNLGSVLVLVSNILVCSLPVCRYSFDIHSWTNGSWQIDIVPCTS